MKCSICGTESKVDARFCSGCGATLALPKTDETMLDLRTAMYRRPVVIPAEPPTPSAPGGTASRPASPETTAPPGSPPPVTGSAPAKSSIGGLVLVLIAVGIVGYFVYRVATTLGTSWMEALTATSTPAIKSAEPEPSSPPATREAVTESTRPEAPSPPPASTTVTAPVPEAAPPAPAVPKAAPSPSLKAATPPAAKVASAPAPAPPRKSSSPPSASKPASPAKSAVTQTRRAAAKAPLAPEAEPLPSAPPVPAPAPAVMPEQAPPQPDRWQEMRDALARCGQESFIGRVVCEQRVTFRYCNGYWGKVAQCPDGQNPNAGR